jgi:uncharacterized protein YbaA (DUF1428 family)
MPRYVDGFLLPIAKKNVKKYQAIAKKASKIWLEHGALEYVETVLDDPNSHNMMSFPKTAGCKSGEVAILAWVIYSSKSHRDKVNAKIMKDPRMTEMMSGKPPFDYTRMSYAGFKTIVEARSIEALPHSMPARHTRSSHARRSS